MSSSSTPLNAVVQESPQDPPLHKPHPKSHEGKESSSEPSAFFEETDVERDIHKRYLEMENFEDRYNRSINEAMNRLKEEQKNLLTTEASPPPLNGQPLKETRKPSVFVTKLNKFRQEESSFDSVFPLSGELLKGLSDKQEGLRQKLIAIKDTQEDTKGDQTTKEETKKTALEGKDSASTPHADNPWLQHESIKKLLRAKSLSGHLLSARQDAANALRHNTYNALLNPEDIPLLKKNKPLKERITNREPLPIHKSDKKFMYEQATYPPLLDLEQLLQGRFKPRLKGKMNFLSHRWAGRWQLAILRGISISAVIISAVLLALVVVDKREGFLQFSKGTFHKAKQLFVKQSPLILEGNEVRAVAAGRSGALKKGTKATQGTQAIAYSIDKNTTLAKLAKEWYGREDYWPYLYYYNRKSIRSINPLKVKGSIMYIPHEDYLRRLSLASLYFHLYLKTHQTSLGDKYLKKAKQLDPDRVQKLLAKYPITNP